MGDMMNEIYSTQYHKVVSVSTILGHKIVFRKIYLDLCISPSHICAYVRLTPPFRPSDDYEYSYETYREGDIFGVDTAHFRNRDQNMTQKLEDARWQITELIQEHHEWQAEQNINVIEPELEPNPPVKQQHISVIRFLNLELD